MTGRASLSQLLADMRSGESSVAVLLSFSVAMLDVASANGGVPDDVLLDIIATLEAKPVLQGEHAWRMITILDQYWDDLTAAQQRIVAEALMAVFVRSPHVMCQFQIAETLAQRYEVAATTEWIADGVRRWRGETRACLIHGAQHMIARARGDESAYSKLVLIVNDALEDEDESVRKEAWLAMVKNGI